jgi:3-isopropylmalate dehydrogenase
MESYSIADALGDGISKEVCDAAPYVLEGVLTDTLELRFNSYAAGAQCYLDIGFACPDETRVACRAGNAILHGASGLPSVLCPDGIEAGQDVKLQTRVDLDLYANVRPIRRFEGSRALLSNRKAGDINYIIVREGNEGVYASRGHGILLRDERA